MFVKVTSEWDGYTSCKVSVPDETDPDELRSYISEKTDALDGFILEGIDPSYHMKGYRLLAHSRSCGMKTLVVTYGQHSDLLDDLVGAGVVDQVMLSVSDPIQNIGDTLDIMKDSGLRCILRIIAIPGITTSDMVEEIARKASFCKSSYLAIQEKDLPEGAKPFGRKDIVLMGNTLRQYIRDVKVR